MSFLRDVLRRLAGLYGFGAKRTTRRPRWIDLTPHSR